MLAGGGPAAPRMACTCSSFWRTWLGLGLGLGLRLGYHLLLLLAHLVVERAGGGTKRLHVHGPTWPTGRGRVRDL
eukprot:scaffold31197_cov54-Phaeocystis_antarctica.AAC.2